VDGGEATEMARRTVSELDAGQLNSGMDRRSCLGRLTQSLKAPVIVAPMFLVSGPALVLASSLAGVIGSLPAANARTLADLEQWLGQIAETCRPLQLPWAVNLIVHKSNSRLREEIRLLETYQPPLVITALGSPATVLEDIHAYGGAVFADVTTPALARKAVSLGVDGLVVVCAGAGGHTGEYSPFAFVPEIRRFWAGPLVVAGAISNARGIRAAQLLGADLVYMGTRFICAKESLVTDGYRNMLVASRMEDIVATKAVTGVTASFLRASLEQAGFCAEQTSGVRALDFSPERLTDAKAWRDIWAAGQGVGSVERISAVEEIVAQLLTELSLLEA
jgi:nitronate monooxygenase